MYNQFLEVMSYFHLSFFVYYCIVIIFIINTIKIFNMTKRRTVSYSFVYDFCVSLLLMAGTIAGLLFQGVILDLSPDVRFVWLNRLFFILTIESLLFIAQIILILRNK